MTGWEAEEHWPGRGGRRMLTSENAVLAAVAGFPSPPGVTAAWLPEIRDAEGLYRVHVQLRDALGAAGERIGPDPAGFLRGRSARALDAWVAGGYYAPDEARGVVRPTWKG